jgi:hypothetical protein
MGKRWGLAECAGDASTDMAGGGSRCESTVMSGTGFVGTKMVGGKSTEMPGGAGLVVIGGSLIVFVVTIWEDSVGTFNGGLEIEATLSMGTEGCERRELVDEDLTEGETGVTLLDGWEFTLEGLVVGEVAGEELMGGPHQLLVKEVRSELEMEAFSSGVGLTGGGLAREVRSELRLLEGEFWRVREVLGISSVIIVFKWLLEGSAGRKWSDLERGWASGTGGFSRLSGSSVGFSRYCSAEFSGYSSAEFSRYCSVEFSRYCSVGFSRYCSI